MWYLLAAYLVFVIIGFVQLRYSFIFYHKNLDISMDELIAQEFSYWLIVERFIPLWNILCVPVLISEILDNYGILDSLQNRKKTFRQITIKLLKTILFLK